MVDCIAPDYLPASYNGVFFDAMVAGSDHGRRGVTGEFPFGEKTKFQDMGIKIRKYSIKGRFQGPDCVSLTNSLIAAVETPGPGILNHPTRGVLTVSCSVLKISDDIVSGQGETNFDMDFIDASTGATNLTGLPVIPKIADIVLAVASSFLNNYNLSSVPFFQMNVVFNSAVSALTSISQSLYKSLPPLNNPDEVWQAVYQSNSYSTNDTWKSPAILSDAIQFSFAAIDVYSKDAKTEYAICQGLANSFALSATVGGNAGACQEALYSTLRVLCAAYMLRASTQIVYTTLEDALANLDAIAIIILEEMSNALALGNDDLYIALMTFQATSMQALINNAYNLPPVISYNFNGGIPSLVAAHEIYGDISQSIALEKRNPYNYAFALGPKIYALGTAS